MKRRLPLITIAAIAVTVHAARVYREVREADAYGPRTVARWSRPHKETKK